MWIYARAPLRVSFAGGGTDLKSFYSKFDGNVANVAINKYALAKVRKLNERVVFKSKDLKRINSYSLDNYKSTLKSTLPLHQSTYNYFIQKYNASNFFGIEVITECQAPIGSGLGSSSTLVVAIAKAISRLMNILLTEKDLATTAYYIERVSCNFLGGKQDHFAASYGGFNFFTFRKNETTEISKIILSSNFTLRMEGNLFLVFTGISRVSSEILSKENSLHQDKKNKLLHDVKKNAIDFKKAIEKENIQLAIDCINKGWELKKKISSNSTNYHIENIIKIAKKNGANACRILGAGGGGYLLFHVNQDQQKRFFISMQKNGLIIESIFFEKNGAISWINF